MSLCSPGTKIPSRSLSTLSIFFWEARPSNHLIIPSFLLVPKTDLISFYLYCYDWFWIAPTPPFLPAQRLDTYLQNQRRAKSLFKEEDWLSKRSFAKMFRLEDMRSSVFWLIQRTVFYPLGLWPPALYSFSIRCLKTSNWSWPTAPNMHHLFGSW